MAWSHQKLFYHHLFRTSADAIQYLAQAPRFVGGQAEVPAEVWEKEWVVHCQPVGKGLGTLKYLAPYIFRA